jgi:hypothetical protein
MEPPVTVLSGFKGLSDDIVLVELPLFDCLINANDILPHNSASTDIQMSNFRIAHQSLWESDS